MKRRFWRRFILISLLALFTLVWAVDYWVTSSAQQQIYSEIALVPHHKAGLLLGTYKYGKRNRINLYYKYRILAAAALFNAGKIDYVIVSGADRSILSYNEPEVMRADLEAEGVPTERIVLDSAGFRTLDSILRCRKVFGQDNFTIISQPFHNERALFIANHKGIHAIAFNARDVTGRGSYGALFREKLARVKMMLDLLFHKDARLYGPAVKIG